MQSTGQSSSLVLFNRSHADQLLLLRVGASYLKSKRKQIIVFITFISMFLTVILFAVLRGSLYVVIMTFCAIALFELVVYWVFGLLSKMGVLVKLISLVILIISSIIFTVVSNKHGYVLVFFYCHIGLV